MINSSSTLSSSPVLTLLQNPVAEMFYYHEAHLMTWNEIIKVHPVHVCTVTN